MRILPASAASAAVALFLIGAPATAQVQTDPTQQQSIVGTWTLVEVDGQLPFTVEQKDDCVEQVTAGTLIFEEDGDWTVQLTEVETCGSDIDEDTEKEDGDYTVEGTTINFRPGDDQAAAPPAAERAADPTAPMREIEVDELVTGTLEGDVIRVRIRDSQAVAVFRKAQG